MIAIIPARSGSKGILNKNIRLIQGRPLLWYTINVALRSGVFSEVFVSTDTEEYAQIARDCGASVPFLRDAEFAQDTSHANEYIVETIKKYEKLGNVFDYFMVLQPTSPLRNEADIKNAAKILTQGEIDSVIAVCEAEHSPVLYNNLPNDLSMSGFVKKEDNQNRQELETFYRINGAIYAMKVEAYMNDTNFYGERSIAYVMPQKRSIDIDCELDFKIAEFMLIDNFKNNAHKNV